MGGLFPKSVSGSVDAIRYPTYGRQAIKTNAKKSNLPHIPKMYVRCQLDVLYIFSPTSCEHAVPPGALQVWLQAVRCAVQQSSPTYHRASAALNQLASDCRVVLQLCTLKTGNAQEEVDVAGCELRNDRPASTTCVILDSSHQPVRVRGSDLVEVIVDDLQLQIDDSEASCTRLCYNSVSSTVNVTDARASIVFKVCAVTLHPTLCNLPCALARRVSGG